jgi:hypothetical protein
MKVKLKARALWSVIEDGNANQQEKMMPMIAKKETTKEAWDAITTMRVGDDRMKKAMAQQLRQKFDLAMFDDGETVEDYALRLSGMVTHLTTLSKKVKDDEIIVKILRSLLTRFKQITIAIKTLLDVSTMSVANLMGRLKEAEAFEEAPLLLQQAGSCTSPRRSGTRRGRSARQKTTPAAAQEAVA